MKYKIVLVPFPFGDLSGIKVRPAVCLTNRIGVYDHVVVAFITSQAHTASEPSDLVIADTDPHFIVTGLKVTSAIRLHRLLTVPESLILRELGEVPSAIRTELEDKLRRLFGL